MSFSPPRSATGVLVSVELAVRSLRLHWLGRWGASICSLALGTLTLFVFRRGLPHVGWIVGYVVLLWLLFLLLSEWRAMLEERGGPLVIGAGEYAIQTLYHNLLLFVLPAYFASATVTSPNVIVLAVVAGVIATGGIHLGEVARIALLSAAFMAAVVFLGDRIARRLADAFRRLEPTQTRLLFALTLAFLMGWLANHIGLATIVGARLVRPLSGTRAAVAGSLAGPIFPSTDFIKAAIFPGGCLPSVAALSAAAERAGLDPRGAQEGVAIVPAALGLPPAFTVRDLLADDDYHWRIGRNYVRLPPGHAHVLHVQR